MIKNAKMVCLLNAAKVKTVLLRVTHFKHGNMFLLPERRYFPTVRGFSGVCFSFI